MNVFLKAFEGDEAAWNAIGLAGNHYVHGRGDDAFVANEVLKKILDLIRMGNQHRNLVIVIGQSNRDS